MKRAEALKPLSRQHHQGLAVAQRLRRVSPADVEAVRGAFLTFWEDEGRRHFRVEEELLLPAYVRHADSDSPEVVRVLTEHAEIRRDAAELSAGAVEVSQLRQLGELLAGHIRHEERVLFPAIEAALSEDEQLRLAAAMAAAEDGEL